MGLAVTGKAVHPTSLTYWWRRLAPSERPESDLRCGPAGGGRDQGAGREDRRALNSTVLADAVATQGQGHPADRRDPPGGPGGSRRRRSGRRLLPSPRLRPARQAGDRSGQPGRPATKRSTPSSRTHTGCWSTCPSRNSDPRRGGGCTVGAGRWAGRRVGRGLGRHRRPLAHRPSGRAGVSTCSRAIHRGRDKALESAYGNDVQRAVFEMQDLRSADAKR